MTTKKKLTFSLLLLFLQIFSHFPHPITARGGARNSTHSSGFVGTIYGGPKRNLLKDEHFYKLDKLAQGYMTNADLEKAMKVLNRRCSSISRIYTIGKSVLGVPLWVMEFTDKPGEEEAEPAFKKHIGLLGSGKIFEIHIWSNKDLGHVLEKARGKEFKIFVGNVHGDEPVGREILLLLANWLCDNYKKDPLATLIIDNVHLHILPSMNPDGYSLRTRGNANKIDLNRDFPDPFFPINDEMDARQPETKAIMSWLKEQQFTASASLHGGALVANYPWDGTEDEKRHYNACPDDKTFRYMASLYSQSHSNMSLSKEFKGGITNGAMWYPIYGGMQDWNYIHGGCFELTLEISDDKWPPAKELSTIWEYNKMSMLNLVASLVKTGVHGKVLSSDYGRPLSAFLSIKGINSSIKASETLADYHRLLVPGEVYEVIATMHGYKNKSTKILLGEEAMSLDFILDPTVPHRGSSKSSCYYPADGDGMGGFPLLEIVPGSQLRVLYVTLVIILVFLFFLIMRRVLSRKNKQSVLSQRSNIA